MHGETFYIDRTFFLFSATYCRQTLRKQCVINSVIMISGSHRLGLHLILEVHFHIREHVSDLNIYVHGSLMSKSERVAMSCYDRVAIGGELLLFDHPGARPPSVVSGEGEGDGEPVTPLPPTAEFAVEELQAALRNKGKQAQEVRPLSSLSPLSSSILLLVLGVVIVLFVLASPLLLPAFPPRRLSFMSFLALFVANKCLSATHGQERFGEEMARLERNGGDQTSHVVAVSADQSLINRVGQRCKQLVSQWMIFCLPQMLDERMKQFEEEKIKWEQQRQAAAQEGKAFEEEEPTMDEERERAWQVKCPSSQRANTFAPSKGRRRKGPCSDTRSDK